MITVTSHFSEKVVGEALIPGDKSISHRSLMIGASAIGETKVKGLLESDDVIATVHALRCLGVDIEKDEKNGVWIISGRGVGGLSQSNKILDLGNSGTAARLLMGMVASHPFSTLFSGDSSLCSRPMDRVLNPLKRMGAQFGELNIGYLPITVFGTDLLKPITEVLKTPSAQVKSAILLAGLNTIGKTTIIEKQSTRDHTENMLLDFGAELVVEETEEGKAVILTGQPELLANNVYVPADLSSAAFIIVAAIIIPGSSVLIRNVCLNDGRTGILETLREMGGKLEIQNIRESGGERVGDVLASYSNLSGVTVPASRAPSMIDEYPILSIAAACASGKTIFEGVSELRVKESDRLATVSSGLNSCNIKVLETEDSLTINGVDVPEGGCKIMTNGDHRIAMAFLVLGMIAKKPITVDDVSMIETSFPKFLDTMENIGAKFSREKG